MKRFIIGSIASLILATIVLAQSANPAYDSAVKTRECITALKLSDNSTNRAKKVECQNLAQQTVTLLVPNVPPPPPLEVCGNGIDDDQDGLIDEGCTVTPPSSGDGIWIGAMDLQLLPTSGAAYDRVLTASKATCKTPNLEDQDDAANVCVMAKALIAARTNNNALKDQVVTALSSIADDTTYNGRALSLGRELAAYVISADLIDLKSYNPTVDSRFRVRIKALLTIPTTGGPSNLIDCAEKRPNNWGMHCAASRAAVAVYLGDRAQLDRIAIVFRGWLGDRSAYAGFSYGDLVWQCDPKAPVGINPTGCMRNGHSIDGVLPDDERRAEVGFVWPPPKENYVYESLQGALAEAVILYRAGYTDVFAASNNALQRAFTWLFTQANYPPGVDDAWETYIVNKYYGASFATIASRPGKNVGWTDWTFAQ